MNSSSVPTRAAMPRAASRSSWRREDLARRGHDRCAVRPFEVGHSTRPCPGAREQAQGRQVGRHARSRRSRSPTTTSRSRRRCSCRRPRRAGSCRPRSPSVTTSSRKYRAEQRLPCRRPCMSVMATTTVSTLPSSTSAFSRSLRSVEVHCHRCRSTEAGCSELCLDRRQLLRSPLDLRPGEPLAGAKQPIATGEHQDDADGDRGVIEVVPVDGAEPPRGA